MVPSLAYTAAFVTGALPPGARRILEIGCGEGALAAALQAQGRDVTAIDSDAACVQAARAAGVDARMMQWPAPIDGPFDAVLFTRSLHHISPLDDAIAAAARQLVAGGRIIVEDFRAEGGGERDRRWFGDAIARRRDDGTLTPEAFAAVFAKVAPQDEQHAHELNGSAAIERALARHGAVTAADAAYYFRYAEPVLTSTAAATLLEEELAAIASGEINPLGRRFVVIPPH